MDSSIVSCSAKMVRSMCFTVEKLSGRLTFTAVVALLALLVGYSSPEICAGAVPSAPTGLEVQGVSKTEIDLSWTDSSGDETGFRIFRDGEMVFETEADATQYADSGLACGTEFDYEVFAFNDDGQSEGASGSGSTDVCNESPETSGISDVEVDEDAANTEIDLWPCFSDTEDGDDALVYSVAGNTNPDLFDACATDVERYLTLDYAADAHGVAEVTVRVEDTGGLYVEASFTVTVNSVDDPEISSVSPDLGPATGGTETTVSGSFFGASGYVVFGETQAVSCASWSDTQIVCETPPHEAGVVDVTVHSDDNGDATATGAFTYFEGPDISASPASVDFGQVWTGASVSRVLTVENNGTSVLTVSGISTGHADVAADPTAFAVDAGQSADVTLTFAPSATGVVSGSLTIESDDPDEGSYAVDFQGEGVDDPPDIDVSPASVTEDIMTDSTASRTITVSNVGAGGPLTWRVVTEFDETSTVQWTTTGATTEHSFDTGPYFADALLQVTINGDYDASSEYCTVFVEGQNIGQIDGGATSTDFITDFQLSAADMAAWTADGVVEVSLVNSDEVNTGYGTNIHEVRLSMEGLPAWLEMTPDSGEVASGDSMVCDLLFDSTGLNGGQYAIDIFIENNDPDENPVSVPAVLNVTGIPDIAISTSALEFGEVFIGFPETQVFSVTNEGSDTLSVTGIASDNALFVPDSSPFSLVPGQAQDVEVLFSPTAEVEETGTLTIASDDPDEATVALNVSGTGLLPPNIEPSPDSFVEYLESGETSSQELTITNTGDSVLNWSLKGFGEKTPLEHVLSSLNANYQNVTDAIPNRFDFSDGVTGDNISDGLNDMYDGGNSLNTNLGTSIDYSDDVVSENDYFGSGGAYFTRKYDGLFVFAADLNNVDYFEITGDLGADGSGNCDATIIETHYNGVLFTGYVKRVYGAGDPSVNHLVIVESGVGADHTYATNTNNDQHRVYDLNGASRIYFLLYAGSSGYYIDDDDTLAIMDAFLSAAELTPWVFTDPSTGTTEPGAQSLVTVDFDATDLYQDFYETDIVIESNDPDDSPLAIPVALHVSGTPDIAVVPASLDFGWIWTGFPASQTFTVFNEGTAPLQVSVIASDQPQVAADIASLSVPPGRSRDVEATFTPSVAGELTGQFTINSDDPDESALTVPFAGLGIDPPDITANHPPLKSPCPPAQPTTVVF